MYVVQVRIKLYPFFSLSRLFYERTAEEVCPSRNKLPFSLL